MMKSGSTSSPDLGQHETGVEIELILIAAAIAFLVLLPCLLSGAGRKAKVD